VNRRAIAMLEELRRELEAERTPVVISGCVGPRGDGYVPGEKMSAADARDYHAAQIGVFAGTAADLVTAITMNYVEEAVGIVQAAEREGVPVVIAFTVETDGRLPSGQALGEAIAQVDESAGTKPAYFMINCAHPTHFDGVLDARAPWAGRIRGLRANASKKSHAELNESPELDIGDPAELARQYADLKRRLPALTVMGGCCGTDERHIGAIADACLALFPA
jgi:homocysteine S-methyltransferase